MAGTAGSPLTRRSVTLILAGIILVTAVPQAWAQSLSRAWSRPGPAKAPARLDRVDYSLLEQQVRRRGVKATDEELRDLVARNFRFVFLNKLKRDRFIVEPKPERVAEHVVRLLQLNEQVGELIVEGRVMVAAGSTHTPLEPGRCRDLVDRIGRVTRDLSNTFKSNFVEVHSAEYSFSIPAKGSSNQFLFYLIQADRIHAQLTKRLDNYFLNSNPGAVRLSDFEQVSITVLAESLIKLGRLVHKRL